MPNNFENILGQTVREQLTAILPDLTEAVSQSVMTRISEAFPKEEKPLSTEEVCRLFDIHPQTANRWRRIGRLPYHETPGGRKVFYLYSEVLEALKQNPSKRKPKAR